MTEAEELEKCKKELAEAKTKLKVLVEEKEKADAEADVDKTEKELEAAAEKLKQKREEQAAQMGHIRKKSEAPCPKGCVKEGIFGGGTGGASLPSALMSLCLSV